MEGKSAAVPVTVISPVAGIQLAPPSLTLCKSGDRSYSTATVVPKTGASTAGLTPTVQVE